MSSLVQELQSEAMNPQTKVTDLLRKALVVARKLEINELRQWVEEEVRGYAEPERIPDYRVIKGEVKATHPMYGFIPYIVTNPSVAEQLSSRQCGQSIAELENLAGSGEKQDVLHMPYPQHVLNELDTGNLRLGIVPTLVVPKSRIHGILETVRNVILEWSLKLEEDGILGEGLSFSQHEKQKASSSTYQIQNFTGVLGNVQVENLQIGDYNSIHAELKRRGLPQEERNELENILDGLRSATAVERESLIKRGTEWVLRHASALGALAEVIRGWFK